MNSYFKYNYCRNEFSPRKSRRRTLIKKRSKLPTNTNNFIHIILQLIIPIMLKYQLVSLLFAFPYLLVAQICNCTISEVQTNSVNPCTQLIGNIDTVGTYNELRSAINLANNTGGNRTILIEDGIYTIASTAWYPYLTASNVVIRSLSGNRDAVVLTGSGMQDVSPGTESVFYVVGNNVTIADLSIRDVGNHGISVTGDSLFVHNVKIQNTYEQMIKGNSSGGGSQNSIVQCSMFEYTAGIGPQFYIGGLDIHRGRNWLVRDNVFIDISSPSNTVAEHAIHFWSNCADNIIERNQIINCDRGIGFGLGTSANTGGIIRNNMIYNDGSGQFNDVGIGLESSPNTKVYNNTIHINYSNAIEYRFASTTGVDIRNNLCNKAITSRNSGQATLSNNLTNAQASWYVNSSNGDLHLATNNPNVVDQGIDLIADVSNDFDQLARPQGNFYDIGAHEYNILTHTTAIEESENPILLFPNPVTNMVTIQSKQAPISSIRVHNILQQEVAHYRVEDYAFTMDSQAWKAGIYTCTIVNQLNQTYTIKLIRN